MLPYVHIIYNSILHRVPSIQSVSLMSSTMIYKRERRSYVGKTASLDTRRYRSRPEQRLHLYIHTDATPHTCRAYKIHVHIYDNLYHIYLCTVYVLLSQNQLKMKIDSYKQAQSNISSRETRSTTHYLVYDPSHTKLKPYFHSKCTTVVFFLD